MRRLATAALRRSPLQPLADRAGRKELRVLAYHAVTNGRTFEQQLDYTLKHYEPVSLSQVLDAAAGRTLPSRAVLFTFDDGHRSWVDQVAPALRSRGIPGVAFVVAGAVGSSVPYWWEAIGASREDAAAMIRQLKSVPDDVRLRMLAERRRSAVGSPTTDEHLVPDDLKILEEAGLEIGNHTVSHPILTQCSNRKVAHEVREAKEMLEDIIGHPVRSFAYPNGNHSPDVALTVAQSGHDVAFLFDHVVQSLPLANPMAVSRIRVNADDSIDTFAIRISGLHPAIHRLRRR